MNEPTYQNHAASDEAAFQPSSQAQVMSSPLQSPTAAVPMKSPVGISPGGTMHNDSRPAQSPTIHYGATAQGTGIALQAAVIRPNISAPPTPHWSG